ncbi:MAG: OsmC family protein [Crocinitomicaceae bacterium]
MATSTVEYLGGLRTKCTHLKSGKEVLTDAPTDNNGKGDAFSPTDLVATAYVSCMLTIIGIYCDNHDINFNYGKANVTKVMGSDPRRIARIEVELDFSENNWSENLHQRIMNAGEGCPVAKTIGDNVELKFEYKF